MKKIVLAIPLMLAILAAPAYAALFTVTVGPSGEVFAEETLDVMMTVHNNAGSEDIFLISQPLAAPPANKWATADKGYLTIPAYSEGVFTISITPYDDAVSGDYRYEFTVKKQSTGEIVSTEFQITVRQREAAGVVRPQPDCTVCTGTLKLVTDVENVGTAKLRDAAVKLTVGEETANLAVGQMNLSGKRSFTNTFDISTWAPGAYSVLAELSANGQSLDTKTVLFSIPEIKNITVVQRTGVTPWSRTTTYVANNFGNVQGQADIKAEVQQSPIVSISYSKPPTVSGSEWIWAETLQPGQTTTISYTEFYWPIPVIIVVAALAVAYFYLFMTSITMRKSAAKHGGDLSVSIHIHNRGQAVEGVVVRDIIPHHFSLSGSFETLKPIVRKMEMGTELIWRIGGIKRGEEKLLHYRMAAKSHPGAGRLPSARLRATKKDKTVLSSSNAVSLAGEKTAPKLNVEQ